uniref:Uncharacterized protein n=1 Tax=Ascaris lumbricoides TaxID=6252 RepID=A0A0M3HHY4_ASCLU
MNNCIHFINLFTLNCIIIILFAISNNGDNREKTNIVDGNICRNFIRHSSRGNENRNGRENKMTIVDESLSMEERAATLIGCAISPYALKNRESTILEEKTMDLVNSLKSDMISSRSCQTVSEVYFFHYIDLFIICCLFLYLLQNYRSFELI